jgi:hypothetical protein
MVSLRRASRDLTLAIAHQRPIGPQSPRVSTPRCDRAIVNGVPGCIVLGLPVDLGVLGKIATLSRRGSQRRIRIRRTDCAVCGLRDLQAQNCTCIFSIQISHEEYTNATESSNAPHVPRAGSVIDAPQRRTGCLCSVWTRSRLKHLEHCGGGTHAGVLRIQSEQGHREEGRETAKHSSSAAATRRL